MTHTLLVILELVWKIGFRIWWRNVCNLKGYLFCAAPSKTVKSHHYKSFTICAVLQHWSPSLSLSLTMCVSVCFLCTVFWFLFPCWHTCSPFTDYCPAAIKHFLSLITRSFPCIVAKMLRPCSDFRQCYLLVICLLTFSHVCFSTLHKLFLKWSDFPSCTLSLLWLLNCCTFILPRSCSGVQHSEKKNNPKT